MGDHCTKSCPSGRFGPDCVHECFCHNGAQCNKVDGRCQCAPGFAGTRCEFECPEGLFGQDCAQACNCPSQNHICNPINGCMCPLSYEGPNCTQPVSPVPEPVLNGSGQPAIIFAGILGSVFVLISIVVICFLKRKHRKLRKEQQAQALYIASSELGGGGGGHIYSMPELKTPLVSREDTTSQLQFNNKVYARAPSCRDLVPPEITFTPATGMSTSSFGGFPPSAPTEEENVYEELEKRRGVEQRQWSPGAGSGLGMEKGEAVEEEEEGEGYDHLDFARTQQLRPHYHSTDTLRSSPQSVQSRSGSQSQLRTSPHHSSRESPDFTSKVLSSVENLKTSTRKTIYEPETDSGISSGQSTVASLPQTSTTTTTDIL